jgi:hypothetical protein
MIDKDPDNPPGLHLASQRSDAEIAAERQRRDAQQAAEFLGSNVRYLSANILRIIAGGGKAHTLIEETTAVLEAYRELQPYAPTGAFRASLVAPMVEALTNLDWRKNNPGYTDYNSAEDRQRWLQDGTEQVRLAEDAIVTAALRVVAARLARQPTQESTSLGQLRQALDEFERARTHRIKSAASRRSSQPRKG